jgi:hypothetical protein
MSSGISEVRPRLSEVSGEYGTLRETSRKRHENRKGVKGLGGGGRDI